MRPEADPTTAPISTPSEAFRRARTRLAPGLALGQKLTGRGALEVAAEGAEVLLSDGRRAIDFGSYAVTLLGHRHPAVVAAVERQLRTLPTSTRVLANAVAPALAERLVELTDGVRMRRVWLGQNGTDVVEVSLKLARLRSGRLRVLAADGSFHGKSLGALAATWHPGYRAGLESLLTSVTHVPLERDAVARELRAGDVAAVLVEPVQGEGGIRPLDPELLRAWADAARQVSAYVISDEVQMGLRRCGPVSLAVEMGLEPDAVLFGKHLGGGVLPLSAMVCTEELFGPLLDDPFVHTTTFSGHPLSCAAALAALDQVEDLAGRGAELASDLEAGLRSVADEHPDLIVDVRGRGLAWGIECSSSALAGELLTELGPNGLLVSPCLSRPDVIRLVPPIVTTDAQLDRALEIFSDACVAASDLEREGVPAP